MAGRIEADCVWDLRAGLGEGTLWSDADRSVYLVDIESGRVHRFTPETGDTRSWTPPARATFIVAVDDGGFLCGHVDGLRRFWPELDSFGPLHPIEPLLHENRLNDGAVDGEGRLWFGTMHDPEREATGSLYRLSGLPDRPEPVLMDGGYIVSNGPAFDPTRNRLYHNDSALRRIYCFDLAADGSLGGKRVFATLDQGYPDGMAVDAEGALWVAVYDGGGVQRFDPDGRPEGFVAVAARHATRIAFGGADRRDLFISTAARGEGGERWPLGGGLFRARMTVPGLPEPAFRHAPAG